MSSPLAHYPGGEHIRRLEDLDVQGKRVFVRVDFNVPIREGVVKNDARIQAALPTIQYLLESGAKVICASHLGRPKGEPNEKMSLEPVAQRLGELLNTEVLFAHDCVGHAIVAHSKSLKEGTILLLENLRFHSGETENDQNFVSHLSQLCDLYVNDAFGTCHRAHASTFGLPSLLKDKAAGFLVEKEISALAELIHSPARPLVSILGGAKVSDKIKVIDALMIKSSKVLIGGAMAHTFLAAKGVRLGESMIENDKVELARKILERSEKSQCKIILPVDFMASKSLDDGDRKNAAFYPSNDVPPELSCFDIGPESRELFAKELEGAQSIFWNGPLGVFEMEPFSGGTFSIAKCIAEHSAKIKIAGGGDSVTAVHDSHTTEGFTHISTGGGASLEMIEGAAMPGIESLKTFQSS